MGLRPKCLTSLVWLSLWIALTSGCAQLVRLNEQQLRNYHQSRWQTVAKAYSDRTGILEFEHSVSTPKRVGPEMDGLYRATIQARQDELEVWTDLLAECELGVEFVAEMLNVLVSRDGGSIERLAPQIDDFVAMHTDRRGAWLANRNATADAVAALRARWNVVWPEHELKFDLAQQAQDLNASQSAPVSDLRRTALEHYHQNEYDRLAYIYLDYEPQTAISSFTHVPDGCEPLSTSLARLEAALLARSSLDEAIRLDVERVSDLTGMDMSVLPWDQVEIPSGRYARPRAQAAMARLRLLKYIDELLVKCLDVYLYDVELEWRELWPAHELETNIFAYANIPEAPQPITDPVVVRATN